MEQQEEQRNRKGKEIGKWQNANSLAMDWPGRMQNANEKKITVDSAKLVVTPPVIVTD